MSVSLASRPETSLSPIFWENENSSRATAQERPNLASHQLRTLPPQPGQCTPSLLVSISLAFVPPQSEQAWEPLHLHTPHPCLCGRSIQGEEEVAGSYLGGWGRREMGEGRKHKVVVPEEKGTHSPWHHPVERVTTNQR